VSKRSNVIEVNGKRYDALTGRLLTGPASIPRTGIVMDGVAKPKSATRNTTSAHTAHKVHQTTERSKTLMRSAVRKPVPAQKPGTLSGVQKSRPQLTPKPTLQQPNLHRAKRATEIPKSNLISKFGSKIPHAVTPKFDILPVQTAPKVEEPATDKLFQSLHHTVNPFQNALEHATSHTQPKHKKARPHHKIARKIGVKPRMVGAGAATLSVLLVVGFFAYQNVPNLAMRVAATKAGVSGNLPEYKPSGFSIQGPIQFTNGQITIVYRSNSDDRSFNVTQRASEWNSDALLKNYVAVDNRPFQTYQDEDKTIFIWVDGGVWYQIEGEKALSSDQLLRMAKSL
jgi:hypothetical protein